MDKLKSCSSASGLSKSEKDKQDMTIFSILLLLSRLVPFAFTSDTPDYEKHQVLLADPAIAEKLTSLRDLIKTFSANGTYFVRKISAMALLPLMNFEHFIVEITTTLSNLSENGKTMRQNQAHGLMVRLNIFIEAYFKYRSYARDQSHFESDEKQMMDALFNF